MSLNPPMDTDYSQLSTIVETRCRRNPFRPGGERSQAETARRYAPDGEKNISTGGHEEVQKQRQAHRQ
jgi:hypothetical protein